MSAASAPSPEVHAAMRSTGLRGLLRDKPIIPLFALLGLLVVVIFLVRPQVITANWVGVILRAAIPLSILGACQTITFLTGGIDLSVGAIASLTGFMVATLVGGQGLIPAMLIALAAAALAGVITGIGIGVFRVHPLIMTLGMSLIILGFANVWQRWFVKTGAGVPPVWRTIGSGTVGAPGSFLEILPISLVIWIPLTILIFFMLKRTGYGRQLYAIGDNPIASRLAGARSWQVIVVLYVISALLAGLAGFVISGLTNVANVNLADSYVLPSVAAAVIGGTSIMGGRGGFAGTIVGALILTVLSSLLTVLGFPEPVRQIFFGSIIVIVAAAYTRATAEG
jgi:ribose transport system permease protein